MSEEKKPEASFRLIGISTEEFATFREHYEVDNPNIEIGLGVRVKADKQDHLVGMFARFTFSQKELPILILESACHFQLEENYWKSIENNQEVILPPNLATHLLVITVGTARGIIHAKKPTWLESLVLTTLDVSKVFDQEDIHVAFSDGE